MKVPWRFYSLATGYNKLFIGLILLFLLAPFGSLNSFIGWLVSIFFLITLFLGLNTLNLPKNMLFLLRLFAALGFIADIIVLPSDALTEISSLISDCSYSFFIMLVILAIGFRISNEEKVDKQVIRGSICVYLLLGVFWFSLYKIVLFFDPNAFSLPEHLEESSLFYFSFTTLTTLGYGDITPHNPFAMTLANTEALVGQMYPAIAIAKLVSLYTSE